MCHVCKLFETMMCNYYRIVVKETRSRIRVAEEKLPFDHPYWDEYADGHAYFRPLLLVLVIYIPC